MKINIKISGLKEYVSAFKQEPEISKKELELALKKSLFVIQRNVRELTPVDTGRLRQSVGAPQDQGIFEVNMGEKSATIGTRVKYAYWVEVIDTNRHPTGQSRYFETGVQKSIKDINKLFNNAMQVVLKKIALKTYNGKNI